MICVADNLRFRNLRAAAHIKGKGGGKNFFITAADDVIIGCFYRRKFKGSGLRGTDGVQVLIIRILFNGLHRVVVNGEMLEDIGLEAELGRQHFIKLDLSGDGQGQCQRIADVTTDGVERGFHGQVAANCSAV